jgi:exodeoxyribonuclease V
VNVNLPLNNGQQAAADGFFEFLFRPERELNISGPGGVGKTFLMSHMIDQIMPRYHQACKLIGTQPDYVDVQMTATTNKAAEVLAVATQRPTSTIHSFLGLKVQDDFSTGKSKLTRTGASHVHQKKIVFIDECSMIDTQLDNMVSELTHDCKIIYVGDHCQLSPVMEPISPVYKRDMPFFELKEQMRTNNPALQAINAQLRQTVETGIFEPIRLVPGTIDMLDDALLQEGLEHYFTKQDPSYRVLAYTNSRVIQYNDHIRTLRNQPDEWQVGENLINNSAIRINGVQVSVEEELEVVSQQHDTESHFVDEDVFLEVRRTTLRSKIGNTLTDVPVPVNPNHFLALVKYYAQRKNWNRMYHLKNGYPDLRQPDAATFHKAQGSTYDTVFIDLGNLSTCHQPDNVARMLYVAFSRARTRVFLYGTLSDKYGGVIA